MDLQDQDYYMELDKCSKLKIRFKEYQVLFIHDQDYQLVVSIAN